MRGSFFAFINRKSTKERTRVKNIVSLFGTDSKIDEIISKVIKNVPMIIPARTVMSANEEGWGLLRTGTRGCFRLFAERLDKDEALCNRACRCLKCSMSRRFLVIVFPRMVSLFGADSRIAKILSKIIKNVSIIFPGEIRAMKGVRAIREILVKKGRVVSDGAIFLQSVFSKNFTCSLNFFPLPAI